MTAIQRHDGATPTSHSNGCGCHDARALPCSHGRCAPFLTHLSFHPSFLPFSAKDCNAQYVHSSISVRSWCAGLELTPTSASLRSRRGVVASPGCPLDNWDRTSCYCLLFGATVNEKNSRVFPGFVCVQPWLCHVTSHFNTLWLSCQQYVVVQWGAGCL